MTFEDPIKKQQDDHEKLKRILNPVEMGLERTLKTPSVSDFSPSRPPMPPPVSPINDAHLASDFCERLKQWTQNFESTLDEEHEVGLRLVSFGEAVSFHLDDIGYWNPFLISFSGVDEHGRPVQLIQHVSQISVLLMKVPRRTDQKRKVGFASE